MTPISNFMNALVSDIKNFGTKNTNYLRLLGSLSLLGYLGYKVDNIIKKIRNKIVGG